MSRQPPHRAASLRARGGAARGSPPAPPPTAVGGCARGGPDASPAGPADWATERAAACPCVGHSLMARAPQASTTLLGQGHQASRGRVALEVPRLEAASDGVSRVLGLALGPADDDQVIRVPAQFPPRRSARHPAPNQHVPGEVRPHGAEAPTWWSPHRGRLPLALFPPRVAPLPAPLQSSPSAEASSEPAPP
jgi:hypothetical protein